MFLLIFIFGESQKKIILTLYRDFVKKWFESLSRIIWTFNKSSATSGLWMGFRGESIALSTIHPPSDF